MSGPPARSLVQADDGVALSVRSRGRGGALVLCHGGPGLWDNLDDLAALLGELFTVWTYDQRGCGRSAGMEGPYTVARFVADLDAVRQATGYDHLVVGGHSWGAVLGFLYAAAHPERVDGVLYIAGVGIEWPKWRPQHRDEARRRLESEPSAVLASQTEERVKRWAIDFADPAVGLARAREMAASGFEVNTECNSALNAELNAVSEDEWLRRCAQVHVPVLVLQGERDPRPLQAVESMLNALPAARRVVLRGAGHYPWVERPEELRREVEAWSRVLPTTAAGASMQEPAETPPRSSNAPARVRVVVLRSRRVLMVQHEGPDGRFWILPGGGVRPGETLEQAAVREVWEEAGARCRILRRLHLPDGVTGMQGYALFLGTVDTDELAPSQNVDGEIVHEVAWHLISKERPIGPLTPRFWAPIAPLLAELVRTEDLSGAPSSEVLRQFGATQAPTRFSFGRGRTWAAGGLVLKPVDDLQEAAWIADLASRVEQRGFRLARPVSAPDGRWIVDGWSAWTRVAGEHSTTRWPEMLGSASAFHAAVAAETKPEFIERRADRWRIADRIAWSELPVGDMGQVPHVERLVRACQPVDLPSQLIHGDLVGNVLFAEGLPPAIIDLSLYWRPPGYSAALVAGDAIAWEGADRSVLDLIRRFEEWPQLLLRAVIFRVVVSELAKRAEPWRADITREYDEIVDLAVSLAAA